MAILRLEDGTKYTNFAEVVSELAPLKIQLKHLPVEKNFRLGELLAEDILNFEKKQQILDSVDQYFEELKRTKIYFNQAIAGKSRSDSV